MTQQKRQPIHYAWWILVMCCALQAGSQGTIFDTCGVFNNPVCADLGFDMGKFTMAQTFGAVAMMVAQPLTSVAYRKFDIRKVLLVSGVVYYLSHFTMSMATEVWHWYILMAIQGIAGGFFYRISYTILICRWFASKTAMALGIATAVGSIMGMIMNPMAASIIETFGWRSCYVILALLGAAITLPMIAIVLRPSVSRKEVVPYTEKAGRTEAVKASCGGKHKGSALVCGLLILGGSVSFFCGGYYPHLSNYCVSMGMTLTVGSMMTSFELGGTMVMKFLIGPILDRLGFMKTVTFLMVLSVVGYSSYFFLDGSALFLTTALCGLYCATVSMVLMPLFAREQVGEETFVRILPWMTTIGAAISSASNTLYGFLFDGTGSYDIMFCICIASILISFAAIFLVNRMKPKDYADHNETGGTVYV